MAFELIEVDINELNIEENRTWIEMVKCYKKRENEFNIYVFVVTVKNELEIIQCYESITASIAVEFQSKLDKDIERWNIYLIFECTEKVSWKIKAKVEQDKYSTRKMIWDDLNKEQIRNKEYVYSRLFSIGVCVDKESVETKKTLQELLKDKYNNLYEILANDKLNTNERLALYLGEEIDE